MLLSGKEGSVGRLLTLNERLEEIRRLREEGKTFEEALEIVKGYEDCDQTDPSNHSKMIKDIIPPGTDLDNDQLYDIETGQTIRDL